MPFITQEQYLIIAFFFVLTTTIAIAVFIGINRKIINFVWCTYVWEFLNRYMLFRGLKYILLKFWMIITAPIWLLFWSLVFISVVIGLIIMPRREEKYDDFYDQEKDPEYIKMMAEVSESSRGASLPDELRQIYIDLYHASLNLSKDSSPEIIYQVMKDSRLDDLIFYKREAPCLTSMQDRIQGNIETLAYFWKDPSYERAIFYIKRALDYAYSQNYISFPAEPVEE
jgi:hypothetical protein